MYEMFSFKIKAEVMRLNPGIKYEDLQWRMDGRLEWICEHGCGHTVYSNNSDFVHGCCGCCENIKTLEIPVSGSLSNPGDAPSWDGTNFTNESVAPGIYYYSIRLFGYGMYTGKIMVMQ